MNFKGLASIRLTCLNLDLTFNAVIMTSIKICQFKEQYGEIPEREQKLRLSALWLNRETMIRVFDWDPQESGY